MTKKNKLSIIITAHSEGLLLHKTICSVLNSVAELKDVDSEIIIHADNPDEKTKRYLSSHERKDIKVFCNSFGDPGLSRNYAINKASGDLIAIIDGDDLISSNWFSVACDMVLNSKEDIVAHPEYNLTFGLDIWNQVLWTQADSGDLNTDKLLLAGVNCWASCCVAKKSVFQRFPYRETGNGYGNEDWCFNCETRGAGIKHLVGKDTIEFYRRKIEDSVLSANNSSRSVQWPLQFFDLLEFKNIPLPKESPKAKRGSYSYYFKRGFRIVHGTMLQTPLKYILNPTAAVVKKAIRYKQNENGEKKLPKYVYEEWQKANTVESQLYPEEWKIKCVEKYTTNDKYNIGRALRLIIEPMTKLPDYVFIAPWLKTGGADKVMLNYIKALSAIHPEWTFAVITTLPNPNEWSKKLPENAYLLDFGNIAKDLNELEREAVFSRLLVELRCKRVHIINSQYGYNFVSSHKELFANNFDLSVSVFCFDYIPGTKCKGVFEYADPYLVDIYDVVKKIYTDNAAYIDRCVERNGFDRDKFTVCYQPIELEDGKENTHKTEEAKTKILWASRIAYQKNPEILLEIAKGLDSDKYQIDVYGEFNENYKKSFFDHISSISYKGKFNGLKSIKTDDYDVFLYTSRIDGVPNAILEAANLGLPIIASNVGGVGEFIKDQETGFLIDEKDKPAAYIDAIHKIAKNKEDAEKYISNAKELLKKQHSWDSFIETIKKDID